MGVMFGWCSFKKIMLQKIFLHVVLRFQTSLSRIFTRRIVENCRLSLQSDGATMFHTEVHTTCEIDGASVFLIKKTMIPKNLTKWVHWEAGRNLFIPIKIHQIRVLLMGVA